MMEPNIYYTLRKIYGIKIYSCIDKYTILFEQKYNKIMSNEMMKEAKVFYENLNENDKKSVKFQIYTKCEGIDYKEDCMIWWNISLNEFIKEFSV